MNKYLDSLSVTLKKKEQSAAELDDKKAKEASIPSRNCGQCEPGKCRKEQAPDKYQKAFGKPEI